MFLVEGDGSTISVKDGEHGLFELESSADCFHEAHQPRPKPTTTSSLGQMQLVAVDDLIAAFVGQHVRQEALEWVRGFVAAQVILGLHDQVSHVAVCHLTPFLAGRPSAVGGDVHGPARALDHIVAGLRFRERDRGGTFKGNGVLLAVAAGDVGFWNVDSSDKVFSERGNGNRIA